MKLNLPITLGLALLITTGCALTDKMLGGSQSDKDRNVSVGDNASQISAESSGDKGQSVPVEVSQDATHASESNVNSGSNVTPVVKTNEQEVIPPNFSLTASTVTSSHISEADRFKIIGQPCKIPLAIHVNFFYRNEFDVDPRNRFPISSVFGCLPLKAQAFVGFDDMTPDRMTSLNELSWVSLIEGDAINNSIFLHITKDAEASDAWEFLVIHGYGDSRYQYLVGFYSSLVRRNAYPIGAWYARPNSLSQAVGFMRWLGADSLLSGPVTHDLSNIQTSANMGKISATVRLPAPAPLSSLPTVTLETGLATRTIQFLSLPSFY